MEQANKIKIYPGEIEYDGPGETISELLLKRHSPILHQNLFRYYLEERINPTRVRLIRTYVCSFYGCCLVAVMLLKCQYVKRKKAKETGLAIFCSLDLANGFRDMIHVSVTPAFVDYYGNGILPETLIPPSCNSPEDYAEHFLSKYYPEFRKNDGPVDPLLIAQRLSLTVRKCCFDPTGASRGKLFFDRGEYTEYGRNGRTAVKTAESGTILVNCPPGSTNPGPSFSNTVMHEIVHWSLHKYCYQLQKGLHPDRTGPDFSGSDSRTRDQEQRVNRISPLILMPTEQTRCLAEQYLALSEKPDMPGRIEETAERLASYFRVSKSLALLRLQELGYTVDCLKGRYLQYDISPAEAGMEIRRNERFRKILRGGEYVYTENRFCLRDNRFVDRGGNTFRLSEYAKQHPEECCLSFHAVSVPTTDSAGMFRSGIKVPQLVATPSKNPAVRRQLNRNVAEALRQVPGDFWDALDFYRKKRNMTVLDFGARCGSDDRTLQRHRAAWPEKRIPLEEVFVYCVVLRLPLQLSMDLIQKSGNVLLDRVEREAVLHDLLSIGPFESLEACNEFLREMGQEPVGISRK